MKTLGLALLFSLSALLSFSQDKSSPRTLIDAPATQDRFIIELHNDMFLETPPGMDVRPWSPGINAYVMYDYAFTEESVLSFAWGYGFSSFNIHCNGQFQRDNTPEEYVRFIPFPENYSWDKNKFSANYLEIPVEFRLRTKHQSPFKISLGGKVGYLVNIHTKTIDEDGKRKFYQLPEINKLRYGATAKIGVGRWSLFGFYSVSPFLNEGEGVPLNAFTAGISIALL